MLLALFLYASLCWLQFPTVTSPAEIVQKRYSLIYFHALDCKYCVAFDPDMEFISELYNDKSDSFQVVRVNGRKSKDLIKQFQVSSFPALKLYDSENKRVTSFDQPRSVAYVESFIEMLTGLMPDYSGIRQDTIQVSTTADLDALAAKQDTVLVFVNDRSYDWRKHYYPNHFYQQLARENPHIHFAFKFAEEGNSALMEKYRVSNFPSVIYFHGDKFTIFNTLSTNHLTNDELEKLHIQEVILENDFPEFESLEALYAYADSKKYDGHKQWRGGFNVMQFSDYDDGSGLDEQFEALLAGISLG